MFLHVVRIEKVRRMYLVVDIMCIAALHLVECVVVAIRESRRLRPAPSVQSLRPFAWHNVESDFHNSQSLKEFTPTLPILPRGSPQQVSLPQSLRSLRC